MPTMKKSLKKKPTTPTYSPLPYRIQTANFDPEKLRLKLLKAFTKSFRIGAGQKELEEASKTFKTFQTFCTKLCKEKFDVDYVSSIYEDGSCCGLSELTFKDIDYEWYGDDGPSDLSHRKTVLKGVVLANSTIGYNSPTTFMKYYDNDQLNQGRKYLTVLKELGWKCTAKFKNVNHNWLNFEMSAHYGDKLDV